MDQELSFASLSFFTVTKYSYDRPTVCNFENAPRPHFCMGLVLEGRGVFHAQGREVEVHPGEIVFIPVGSRYVSEWSGEPNVIYISMHFSFFSHAQFLGGRSLCVQKICPSEPGELASLFRSAFAAYACEDGQNFAALADFFRVMSIVYPRLCFTGERRQDERIARAAYELETHYSENCSIEELATLAHMSVSHFHAVFKATMGMTPVEYRNHIRVRHAILRLIRTDQTVERISEDLGFESVTYFRRVFKKETGCPPSKYNQMHMKL